MIEQANKWITGITNTTTIHCTIHYQHSHFAYYNLYTINMMPTFLWYVALTAQTRLHSYCGHSLSLNSFDIKFVLNFAKKLLKVIDI